MIGYSEKNVENYSRESFWWKEKKEAHTQVKI